MASSPAADAIQSPPQAIVIPDKYAGPAIALVQMLNQAAEGDPKRKKLEVPISETEFKQRVQEVRKHVAEESGSSNGSTTIEGSGSDGSENWEKIESDVIDGYFAVNGGASLIRMGSSAGAGGTVSGAARRKLQRKKREFKFYLVRNFLSLTMLSDSHSARLDELISYARDNSVAAFEPIRSNAVRSARSACVPAVGLRIRRFLLGCSADADDECSFTYLWSCKRRLKRDVCEAF